MVKITPDHKRAVLLLRYHKEAPTEERPTFESEQRIGNKLGITMNQVKHICRYHFNKLRSVPL